jgi:flagellar biosynthetic protein FliR
MGWEIPAGDWGWLIGSAAVWGLVTARALGLCLTAPVLAVPELDWKFRLVLAALLSAVLAPLVGAAVEPPRSWSMPIVAWAGVSELLTGGLIGWSAALIIAGARAAGELVAAQAALATATLIDPESGETINPLGRLYGWIALAVFLALNGPILLVHALVESYQVVPAGRVGLSLSIETATAAFSQVGRVLELALRAAAPPALALALAGIAVGWLSRAAPALPFTALALPLRSLTGIALVLLSTAALAATFGAAWSALFRL